MSKQIVVQTSPDLINATTVGFIELEFDKLIWSKGYRVIHEKALKCPCKSKRVNQQSNCKNCGSTGWIFINPIETRMSLYGMNQNTDYKQWSEENMGRVNISVMNKDRVSFMDKITLIEGISTFNEVRHFKKSSNNELFVYCSYHIREVLYVGLFISETTILQRLVEVEDYTFDGNKVFLTSKFLANFIDDNTYSISIRYSHQPQYYVQDLPRTVANSRKAYDGNEEFQNLPLNAIGRSAHFILDMENMEIVRLSPLRNNSRSILNSAKPNLQ